MSQNSADVTTDVFNAYVHDVRTFSAFLRGIAFSNRASMEITPGRLIVRVEEARSLLAAAFIEKTVFDEYTYNPSDAVEMDETQTTALEFPLGTLIECLNIFGTAVGSSTGQPSNKKKWARHGDDSGGDDDNEQDSKGRRTNGRLDQYFSNKSGKATGMKLSYTGEGYPLTLLLAEDGDKGPTTSCEITTYEADPYLDLQLNKDNIVLKAIFKSVWLRTALSELDSSCEKLSLIANPLTQGSRVPRTVAVKPLLRIQGTGSFGSTDMDFSYDSQGNNVFDMFECEHPIKFTYKLAHVSRALRALQESFKTSLRIDDEGILSLQFLMQAPTLQSEEQDNSFIDFRCLPLDDG